MCLPFSCGGGDKGDDASHDPSSVRQHFRPPQEPPPPPGTTVAMHVPPDEKQDNGRPYNKPLPVKEEAHGHHATSVPAPAGGGGMMSGGARRSAQAGHPAPTTPATTPGFTNKHRDQLAAQQAPQSVSASPRHHHGHGSSAAPHPSEAAADNMKAPLPVLPMARRPGGEDYY